MLSFKHWPEDSCVLFLHFDLAMHAKFLQILVVCSSETSLSLHAYSITLLCLYAS